MNDLSDYWSRATPWREFLRPEMEWYDLWKGIFDRVTIPDWAREGFASSAVRRLLILAADWCGDAANTVPVLAALAENTGRELAVLDRDRFPELMDRYLTNGSRSIPIVIALDQGFRELGHWGPRPEPLQSWMLANRKMIPTPRRYAYARRWYAKDRGETTLRELLAIGIRESGFGIREPDVG